MTAGSGHRPAAELLARALRPTARLRGGASRHLAECLRCSEGLRLFSLALEAVRRPDEEPPTAVLQRAYELGAPVAPTRRELSRFFTARLLFDSAPLAAASMVRAPLASREQVWRTSRADVDLKFIGRGPGAAPRLLGQILPRAGTPAPVGPGWIWLHEPGRPPRRFEILPSGEFAIPAPGGSWRLILAWGRLRLSVEAK